MASLSELLEPADIRVNGDRPWDLVVHDNRLEQRVRRGGLLALGDAYVEGWWDCDAIDDLFERLLRADIPHQLRWTPPAVGRWLIESALNLQSRTRSVGNIRRHYNLGTDLFRATLDPRMVYSCGSWRDARDLESAQRAKLDLVCRKAGLRPGMRVLDIGCGWGGLCRYAAEEYGCEVVGVTLSEDQVAFASEACAGLPVEIRLQDYRDVRERFDRIVSVGMFEHVGAKNHRAFMETAVRCLDPEDGLMLLHFFATQRSWPNRSDTEVLWIEKRIFPGMVVPSLAQVGRACEGLFVLEDLENFGADYEPTLLAWHENFTRHYEEIREQYPPPFDRLWSYYLLSCAGAFRSRKYQVWQFALSPRGVRGGYRRPPARRETEEAPPEVTMFSRSAIARL